MEKIKKAIYLIEDFFLVSLLLIMILVCFGQVFFRNYFESSSVLIKNLVLWIGLLGAMNASRNEKHIKIDFLINKNSKLLPNRAKLFIKGLSELFVFLICCFTSYHSIRFFQIEYETKSIIVIPIAFFVIALRYLVLSFENFKNFCKKAE